MLREQMLMGLSEGPMAQALRVYARRNPDEDFTALRTEALLLESEHGSTQTPEIACHAVNPIPVSNPPQESAWKKAFKQEIMDDVKVQLQGLTKELVRELRPLLQSGNPDPRPSTPPPPERRYVPAPRDRPPPRYAPQQRNEWDSEGRPICRQCGQPGHIARFCRIERQPLN